MCSGPVLSLPAYKAHRRSLSGNLTTRPVKQKQLSHLAKTQGSSMARKLVMKKTKHEKEHPPKWNPGNSERGKIVGTPKYGKGHSAPRNPSKTVKKQYAGRRLKTSSR
jgi:hypothetical protein